MARVPRAVLKAIMQRKMEYERAGHKHPLADAWKDARRARDNGGRGRSK